MTDTLARALEPTTDHTIDRRKLLKVGAWAAPVVVLAAAVPAASASVDTATLQTMAPPTISGGQATFSVPIKNNSNSSITVSIKLVPQKRNPDGSWTDVAPGEWTNGQTGHTSSGGVAATSTATFAGFGKLKLSQSGLASGTVCRVRVEVSVTSVTPSKTVIGFSPQFTA
ncbi:hypothetical protein [Microbacterium sp. NPDC056569]|uniref:hypothetical protein n=1 Tax=Microbacterium sp. NPDC056569 TaxID=3345867 RepID=UPI0036714628